MSGRRLWALRLLAARSFPLVLVVLIAVWPAPAAAPRAPTCLILEGMAIAGVHIGTPEGAALAIAGRALVRRVEGARVIHTLRAPWSEMVVERGLVQRVRTRSSSCRTRAQIGPGSPARAVRPAYATAPASTLTPLADGEMLAYPFNGIAFLLRRDRVDTVEVFAAEHLTRTPPVAAPQASQTPGPVATTGRASVTSPQASGQWLIRGLVARVEGVTLVVSGIVENRGRPLSVYVEVTGFDLRDQTVGSADAPVDPSPLSSGSIGRFEARVPIEDLVRRYTVILRPVGAITGALADGAGDIRGRAQFAQVMLRRVQVTAEPLVTPPSLFVTLKNGSAAPLASATAAIDYQTRCFVQVPRPGRFVLDQGTRTVSFGPVAPGGSTRVSVPVAVPFDGCLEFVILSVRVRTIEVRPAD